VSVHSVTPPKDRSLCSKSCQSRASEARAPLRNWAARSSKVAGKVLGNEQMEAEGRVKEVPGEAKQEAANAGRTEGKFKEIKGEAKQKANE